MSRGSEISDIHCKPLIYKGCYGVGGSRGSDSIPASKKFKKIFFFVESIENDPRDPRDPTDILQINNLTFDLKFQTHQTNIQTNKEVY